MSLKLTRLVRSGFSTHRAIDGPLLQPLHLAAPVQLGKYEALKLGRYPADGDTARQARGQLVAVAEELVTVGHSALQCSSPT